MKSLRIGPSMSSILLAMMLYFPLCAEAQSGLEGVWNTGEDNSKVEIFEQDGEYFGKLISSDNPKAKMGTEILRNFSQVNGIWQGTIYAVKRDKLYKASITPAGDTLKIAVSAGMVTQKLSWTKTTP
jgi:uncharacterized protein (DUF2147 family)